LTGDRPVQEGVKPFAQSRACRVLGGGGATVVTVDVRNAEVQVDDTRQEEEAETSLRAVAAVDHLVRRDHSENSGRQPIRQRQASRLEKAGSGSRNSKG